MADPKYEHLYGIARDQPDIYETSDLPEADQQCNLYEEASDAVERLHINCDSAFKVFRGKILEGEKVNFAENIGKPRNTGYIVTSGEWELAAFGDKENIAEKFNRLKIEVENLSEETENSLKTVEGNDARKIDLEAIADGTTKLIEKLKQIDLNDRRIDDDVAEKGKSNFKNILKRLDDIAAQPNPPLDSTNLGHSFSDAKGDAIKYELNVKPKEDTFNQTTRLAMLEQKLSKLESLVGTKNDDYVRLCQNRGANKGLLECAHWMIAKLSLLESSQLDTIETRASTVNAKVEQLIEKCQSVRRNADAEDKIEKLYELSSKIKEQTQIVPRVIERMTALEYAHEQSANCAEKLDQLEAMQTDVSRILSDNDKKLAYLDEKFKSSVVDIKSHLEKLRSKVESSK